jgi:hypothetical protein
LTKQKGKLFRFQEEDLEWINPLISEWTEENEGKDQADLITELLQDFKQKHDTKKRTNERAQKLQESLDKIRNPLESGFSNAGEKLGNVREQLDEKAGRTNARLKKYLSKTSVDIKKALSESSEKIKEYTKRSESE